MFLIAFQRCLLNFLQTDSQGYEDKNGFWRQNFFPKTVFTSASTEGYGPTCQNVADLRARVILTSQHLDIASATIIRRFSHLPYLPSPSNDEKAWNYSLSEKSASNP